MQITTKKIKQIIREEVQRMTVSDSSTLGYDMAEKLIQEFKDLSVNDRQTFLTKFVKFLNEENT